MFRLKFFGSFTNQRKALGDAQEFSVIPLHPSVEGRLNAMVSELDVENREIKTPNSLFSYLVSTVRGLVIECALWSAVSVIIVLGAVLVTRYLFKEVLPLSVGLGFATIFFLLKVIQAIVDYFNAIRRLQVHRGIQASLYHLINRKILHIDPLHPLQPSKGQLKTLIASDVEGIEDFISAALLQWVPALVSIIVLTPALWVITGWLGLISLGVALSILPIAIVMTRYVEQFQRKTQEEKDSLTTLIGEWVKNIRLVRFLGWSDAIEDDAAKRMRILTRYSATLHGIKVFVFGLSFSWGMTPLLVMLFYRSMFGGAIHLTEIFSTFWILDHLVTQIQRLPFSLSLYGSAVSGAKRVIELLEIPNLNRFLEKESLSVDVTTLKPKELIIENVSLKYGDLYAINNISVKFSLHERTAIVGKVGSGKSSLLEIVIGDIHPTSGKVLVRFEDGTTESLWNEKVYFSYRSSIAYSPQRPFISNTSLRLNIDLSGRASNDDLENAVIASQLKPDVLLLPRLYEEEIGESGINLSGGQKQRVNLARAFLSNRRILMLDDPLSAMDPLTEENIMDSILAKEAGLILVSHRLKELERCDRVIVIDEGNIIEDGAPKLLMQNPSSSFSEFLRALENHNSVEAYG